MLFQTLSRSAAAQYSAFAIVPLVLGVGATVWVLQSKTPDHNAAIAVTAAPAPDKIAPAPDKPAPPAEREPESGLIAARFDSIKNRPLAVQMDEKDPGEIGPIPETPTATIGDIKYIGPVKLGPITLAILNIEGKQQTLSKGRSFVYTAAETPHSARVLDVNDERVLIEENGAEHTIARADHTGEVVSYIGGKPTRSGKPIAMRKRSEGGEDLSKLDVNASSEYLAKKAEVLQQIQPILDQVVKDPMSAGPMLEKAHRAIKDAGLDPSILEEALGASKHKSDQEK